MTTREFQAYLRNFGFQRFFSLQLWVSFDCCWESPYCCSFSLSQNPLNPMPLKSKALALYIW